MSLTRSIGQGHFHSKFNPNGTSIIKKLASRSITGRGLQIKIHQHIGYRVHLLWDPNPNDERSTCMCIERVFSMYNEVSDFCNTLTSKAVFEGTCNCACITVSKQFEDKIEQCHAFVTEPVFCHRSCLRTIQEYKKNKSFPCNCRVTSSHAIF